MTTITLVLMPDKTFHLQWMPYFYLLVLFGLFFKKKNTSLMNLTCIWFVYQIAQNKCDKRIDIAAFLALKQIVDSSHPYSKYSVCIVMHSLLFSISIYNAAVKKMVTQESKISGPRSHS